jgi:hypothetical protein
MQEARGSSPLSSTGQRHKETPEGDYIGGVVLHDLTTREVQRVLTEIAAEHSTRTVGVTHHALERAIRHAEANDYVRRNVAALVRPPAGRKPGRPSKSLTVSQAAALLAAAEGSRGLPR